MKNDTDIVQCDRCSTVGFTFDFCPQYMNIAGRVACMHCLLPPSVQRNRLYVNRTELTQGRQNFVFVGLNFGLTMLAKCQVSLQKML